MVDERRIGDIASIMLQATVNIRIDVLGEQLSGSMG